MPPFVWGDTFPCEPLWLKSWDLVLWRGSYSTCTVCPLAATTQHRPVPCPREPAALTAAGGRKLALPMPLFPLQPSLFLDLVTTWVVQSNNLLLLSFWSPVFSPSASIILRALFFLLIQTKHCLSVIGRALQGSCPQCGVIHRASCASMALFQHSGTGCRADRRHKLEWSVPGPGSHICPFSACHRGPERASDTNVRAWVPGPFLGRTWCALRVAPIKNEKNDTMEHCVS